MAKQTFTTGQVLTAAQMTSLQQTAMGGGPATAKTANYVLVAADAGTTVAMNAAGSTTITVNTGLFAAGDTVFIQNLGAGSCTITAGTATVATAGSLILPQNDAGILYFTSTSAAIFYDYIQVGATSPLTTKGDIYVYGTSDTRLPVGTNGYTLVANSSTSTGLEWQAPSSGASFAGAKIYRTTTQSISNSTATAVGFDAESYDVGGYHDNSTNNSRFTIPAGKGGYYLITSNIRYGNNSTGGRSIDFYKNGTRIAGSYLPTVSGSSVAYSASTVINGAVADYFEVYVYQDSGGSLNITSGDDTVFATISYLGA